MSLVFDCNMPELKTDKGAVVSDSSCKFVLLALADHASEDGEGCYPGVRKICRKTNLSIQTVVNALNALRHNGFTQLEGQSKRHTFNYTVLVARIAEFQWVEQHDSSGQNTAVPVARAEPSLKPSLKPPREERLLALDFKSMTPAQAHKLPSLILYLEATDFFPGSLIWEYVHNFITANSLTKAKLHDAAEAWTLAGFRRENVKGILEWALNGIPEKHKVKIEKSSTGIPRPNMRELDDMTPIPYVTIEI